ncbi:UDP-4-amino-4-deoxy-L-arabinose--oxoglutarate aminotransferase [Candidatus Magnetomorum sp. HK-1]|nr:UDP-4-amino-4-deoxy-L-arabinose--oxoglutarate aminotransferase [Candidatus Magnetomorum sp. HK-1]
MWKIPLFDISFGREEVEAAKKVVKSGWISMGKITQEFERQLSNFLGCKYCFVVSNGTAALHLANIALGIGDKDEVICPSLTFVAGANSIKYTGAKPVFADVESIQNFCISPKDIESKITNKTKAIQVMHFAGYPCEMDSIIEIATRYKLFVIEDSAHSIGSIYKGKKCGTIGDVGCFSFFSNKNLSIGEGGLVVTNKESIANKLRLLRSHGMTTLSWDRTQGHAFSYDVIEQGYNYRINEISSAIGMVQLKKLVNNNEKRERLVNYYKQQLSHCSFIQIPFKDNVEKSSFHIFPILLDKSINRKQFMLYLKQKGIQSSIHYPPIHTFSYYKTNYNNQILPVTNDIGKCEVTLPLYPNMKNQDIDYMIDIINTFKGEKL